jgi:hypothetical protein
MFLYSQRNFSSCVLRLLVKSIFFSSTVFDFSLLKLSLSATCIFRSSNYAVLRIVLDY